MMDYKEFTETVLQEVRERAGGRFDAWITVNKKNNGVKCTGISAKAKGGSNGPCIYLGIYYKEYTDKNMELHHIVKEVYGQIMEHLNDIKGINTKDFLDWGKIKGCIYAKLINAEQNRDQLNAMPHRMFLDLAVVYYIAVSVHENQGMGTILIHDQYMSIWDKDEETLYQTALENMRSDGDPIFGSMLNFLRDFVPECIGLEESEDVLSNIGAYILTNCHKHYGASQILDKNTLREISDMINDDYIF